MKEKLEIICLHKGEGCSRERECNGMGFYIEQKKEVKCNHEVYKEIELWRTTYMQEIYT